MNYDNILSYFIKDIIENNKAIKDNKANKANKENKANKDIKDLSYSVDNYGYINIYYRTSIIYWCKKDKTYNGIKAISKENNIFLRTNKIFIDFEFKKKQIFCNSRHINSIRYYYRLKKYLFKYNISYCIKYKNLRTIKIIYYNMYKYKYNINFYTKNKKIKSAILFTNKYELNYINTFFRLYFALIID
jgi:hypothetical protein